MDTSERRNRAEEEAAEWWLRLQTGEMSRAEREQFVDWLRESAVHIAETLRVASVHGSLEQFQRWADIATGHSDGGTVVPLPRRGDDACVPARRSRHVWPVAAVLTCVAITATLLLANLRGQTLETERGERREVSLADGSVVYVDPESRLRVKFEERSRRVFLDAGRAFFRVAKDPDRPFLVQADATTVRAVGTAFGVERKGERVVITVAEGKVAVEGAGANSSAGSPRGGRPRSAAQGEEASAGGRNASEPQIFLTANEQVTVQPSGLAAQVRQVDSARALAWADGRLVFEDAPLAEVITQFNRYNRIQLRIDDEQLARRPISGVFNAADPESFVAFIQSTASVHVMRERAGDIVIVTSP